MGSEQGRKQKEVMTLSAPSSLFSYFWSQDWTLVVWFRASSLGGGWGWWCVYSSSKTMAQPSHPTSLSRKIRGNRLVSGHHLKRMEVRCGIPSLSKIQPFDSSLSSCQQPSLPPSSLHLHRISTRQKRRFSLIDLFPLIWTQSEELRLTFMSFC